MITVAISQTFSLRHDHSQKQRSRLRFSGLQHLGLFLKIFVSYTCMAQVKIGERRSNHREEEECYLRQTLRCRYAEWGMSAKRKKKKNEGEIDR